MKQFYLLIFFFIATEVFAQQDSLNLQRRSRKGTFYLAFGYNHEWYTKSDIHVKDASGDVDFVLHDMKAHDRTHLNEVFRVAISIPQYGYRLGYWLPGVSRWGLELNFDHAKYIVNQYQRVRLTGQIFGQTYDKDTLVDPNYFFDMEHTDGANFLMLNIMRRHSLIDKQKFRFSALVKLGGGIVIPRTEVLLFGQRWDHCFHVAGQIAGIEAGVRAEFFRFFFIEPTIKGVFANFNKVLVIDDILIDHRFGAFMVLLHAGFQIPLGKVDPYTRTGWSKTLIR
jgi:hypothetical protein